MNALSNELSVFASLMVESTKNARICDEETRVTTEQEEEEELQSRGEPPDAAVLNIPACGLQVDNTTQTHPADLEAAPLASTDQRTSEIAGRHPLSQSRAQSEHLEVLRTNPPKPNRARFRSKNKERGRPKQHLRTKVREILSSPTLWKEHQSKSFKRQQQARHLAEQESLEAEQAAAAHFKRAQYALKLSRGCPERQVPDLRPKALYDASYLKRFWKDRRGLLPPPQEVGRQNTGPVSSPKGLLCGVCLHGKRQLGLAYFTCTTLVQLEERVCLRFGISSILNLCRQRAASTKQPAGTGTISGNVSRKRPNRIRTFQRITSLDQVQDGDRLCATQDSYEDMAILCEWIKHRQQQLYRMQQPPPTAIKPSSGVVQRSSEHASKINNSSTRGPAFTASTAQVEENTSLWDANGRCMAVKKQLIV